MACGGGELNGHKDLTNRVGTVSDKSSIVKYILKNECVKRCKRHIKAFATDDGIINSAIYPLYKFKNDNS